MKKSKLITNIAVGIAIYFIMYLLLYFLIIALPILIFHEHSNNNLTTTTIFSFLPILTIILVLFISHITYYKILYKINTKNELSTTLKTIFIIFLILDIILGLINLLIVIFPLIDTIVYLLQAKRIDKSIHNEKIEQLYSSIKPEVSAKMFKNSKEQISNIIISLSQIFNVNLNKCNLDQYKYFLKIFGEVFVWKIDKKASNKAIITSLQKYHKDYITSEDIAKNVLSVCEEKIAV